MHIIYETFDNFFTHGAHRSESVRLKHYQQASLILAQGADGGGDFVGVVGKIINNGYIVFFTDNIKTAFCSAKIFS